jgi:hydroxymethylglutaryl-CoA lyase
MRYVGPMDEKPAVKICEMSPRDGLQVVNRGAKIDIEDRVALISTLQQAGLPYIEAGAFVSPKRIPAMADSADLLAALRPYDGQLAALVPNLRYYQTMIESKNVDTVALFVSASEHYAQKNTRMTVSEAVEAASEVARAAVQAGYRIRCHVSGAYRDLTEQNNPTDANATRVVCERLRSVIPDIELALADTDGNATGDDIDRVLVHMRDAMGLEGIGVHLHDRDGHGIEHARIAYQLGVRVFDAAVGGIGGNPSALANPVGNVATEELVAMVHKEGGATGVDTALLLKAGEIIANMCEQVGDPSPPSRLLRDHLAD